MDCICIEGCLCGTANFATPPTKRNVECCTECECVTCNCDIGPCPNHGFEDKEEYNNEDY